MILMCIAAHQSPLGSGLYSPQPRRGGRARARDQSAEVSTSTRPSQGGAPPWGAAVLGGGGFKYNIGLNPYLNFNLTTYIKLF